MRKALAAMLGSITLLTACGVVDGPRTGSERRQGAELVGRTARLIPARGQASTLYFRSDGTVRSTFGRRSATGRWRISNGWLCFLWSGNFRECWPYRKPFEQGQTVNIRSDRGNLVRVTLL